LYEKVPKPKIRRQNAFTLKTALKIKKNKNTKTCQYLENGWKYRKILEISV